MPTLAMQSKVSEKLIKIVEDIDKHGNASLTRLIVLKKWFAHAKRLSAFGLWMAAEASSRKGKTRGVAGDFITEARRLLARVNPRRPTLNRKAVESLHDRLRDFQSEYQRHQWGPVRIVHHWDLMLVEQGLAIWLWHANSPAHGYKLAADYCQHFDSHYGNGLNGPSAAKIKEIVRFIVLIEAGEESIARGLPPKSCRP